MTRLPDEFLQRMQQLLGDEYQIFLDTFNVQRYYGLRVNTLKLTPEELQKKVPFHLKPIPWVKEGFYYEELDDPGKHHYHNAGLYYIQEPSAMAPGSLLGTQPGERILDLCAAPGGKTTQIAAALQGQGVVVANDISLKRAQVLAMNVERMGITNAFITNETPERLAQYFPGYFDRILVDAPCSGEGMFRKMPEATNHWSLESIAACSLMQQEILDQAVVMLKPGGVLVYSTCTFAPEEDEGSVQNFLNMHPDLELMDMPMIDGFQPGRPEWVNNANSNLVKTIRLWPQYLKGEGHYVAKIRKKDGSINQIYPYQSSVKRNDLEDYYAFCQQNLQRVPKGEFTLFGSHLYLTPSEIPDFSRLKVVRPGWYLGEFKKNRFEPAHSLALGLKVDQVLQVVSHLNTDEIASYLRGETLQIEGGKGWVLISVDGFPLGWGKRVNNILKNHYPRSMRWLF